MGRYFNREVIIKVSLLINVSKTFVFSACNQVTNFVGIFHKIILCMFKTFNTAS